MTAYARNNVWFYCNQQGKLNRNPTTSKVNSANEIEARLGTAEQVSSGTREWSSVRYYLNDPPKQQEEDLPVIHGLPAGVLD